MYASEYFAVEKHIEITMKNKNQQKTNSLLKVECLE